MSNYLLMNEGFHLRFFRIPSFHIRHFECPTFLV
jgi:hypothetical protein